MVDLHVHSWFSDGRCSPAELFAGAARQGLEALVVCDHDTLEGWPQCQAAAAAWHVATLPGVEISTCWEEYDDIHLLVYGVPPDQAPMAELLQQQRRYRRQRYLELAERINGVLKKQGRPCLGLEGHDVGHCPGRVHLARELCRLQVVASVADAFRRYLKPYHVPRKKYPLPQVVEMARAAGGVTVVAHPQTLTPGFKHLQTFVEKAVACGVQGLEVWHNAAHSQQMQHNQALAQRWGLLSTGGSDFHAPDVWPYRLGRLPARMQLPYNVFAAVQEHANAGTKSYA